MAFKLTEVAQGWWRAVNAQHLVAHVRGLQLVERPTATPTEAALKIFIRRS